jgi:hypothetical protein
LAFQGGGKPRGFDVQRSLGRNSPARRESARAVKAADVLGLAGRR